MKRRVVPFNEEGNNPYNDGQNAYREETDDIDLSSVNNANNVTNIKLTRNSEENLFEF